MSRINTNVSSMLAQRVLGLQNRGLTTSLERLSTGFRINRGGDDPAGLIASESLRSEKAAISSAINNAQRAEQVVNVAEGGLQEINNLLLELQSLVGESANEAGLSVEEKEANQLQIDSILQTIDRIANTSTFNGQKLLNGNFDYTVENVADAITDVEVNAAKLSDSGDAMDIVVNVLSAAEQGGLFLSAAGITDGSDTASGSVTIEITGNKGSQQFTFASGTAAADIVTAINSFSEATGVTASGDGATGLILESEDFGSAQFVRAKVLDSGAGDLVYELDGAGTGGTGAGSQDQKGDGVDATMLINGQTATTNGLTARVAADGFDVTVKIDGTSTLNTATSNTTFQITGGGANFSIAQKVSLTGRVSIGIGAVSTGNLGGDAGLLSALKSGGTGNVVNGNLTEAQEVVDSAIKQVSSLRGRLGAFQKNTLNATINNLGVALENTSAAESQIRDTDFAAETAMLTRQQIMTQAATQALAIANAQPQAVLALLG